MKLMSTPPAPASSPRQSLWRWLKALGQPATKQPNGAQTEAIHHPIISPHPDSTTLKPRADLPSTTIPLKVVRVLDADQSPSQVGRMLISGRMVDVCAELDRLAARELTLRY